MRAGVGLIARDRVEESSATAASPSARTFRQSPALSAAASPRCCRRAARRRKRARSARASGCSPTTPRCRSRRCRAAISRRSSSGAGCASAARLLIAEDPTAGVDVGAKAEIYRLLDHALELRPQRRRRLDRFRGGGAPLPPRAGVLARRDRRRTLRRGHSPSNASYTRPRSPQTRPRERGRRWRPRSNPPRWSRRRSEMARPRPVRAAAAACARLWSRHSDRRARAAVQHPAARHLPDNDQPALDHLATRRSSRCCRLAVMIPMVAGKIDLTVGYGIVLWHILAISLQTKYGFPWPLAVLTRARARRPWSASSTACSSRSRRSTPSSRRSAPARSSMPPRCGTRSGRQVVGIAPDAFYALNGADLVRPADHRLLRAGASGRAVARARIFSDRALFLRHRRQSQSGGAKRRAGAALHDLAFVASGLIAAFAGVMLASKLRIGQASVGLEYLLPALVGAFLGSTTIKPGRVNVWGTIVGVAILAIGISGIQQFGATRSSSSPCSTARRFWSPSASPATRSEGAASAPRARPRHGATAAGAAKTPPR